MLDILFINTPLKNYDIEPKYNKQTLPVLGLAYLATYAQKEGLNVEILDAEEKGIGISQIVNYVNEKNPRWVGLSLLAPTYSLSTAILQGINKNIQVMLGGHQARAEHQEILSDGSIPRIDALIIGEGETRVSAILKNIGNRSALPLVFWRENNQIKQGHCSKDEELFWLAPDVNLLPFVNRELLVNDPFRAEDGRMEANMIASRGCVYNCSFCGAARDCTTDVIPRRRSAENIFAEQRILYEKYKVTAFRFLDELFLSDRFNIQRYIEVLEKNPQLSNIFVWDANGRINVFHQFGKEFIQRLKNVGLREISLGIESGSDDMLKKIGKRNTRSMILPTVRKIMECGISVKGFFIMGFPSETKEQINETVSVIAELQHLNSCGLPAKFRASVFEFCPYPGTKEWQNLIQSGKFTKLQSYTSADITQKGTEKSLYDRDEFSRTLNRSFSEVPVSEIRSIIAGIMKKQKGR